MPTISVHVDDATFKLVGEIAERDDRSKSWVVTNALKKQLAHERWMIAEIEEGMAELKSGTVKLLDHDAVMTRALERVRTLDAQK